MKYHITKYIVVILLILGSQKVSSDDSQKGEDKNFFTDNSFYEGKGVKLTYTGRTYHLTSRNRNEQNNIFGINYKGLELSTMKNSFYNRTYIVSFHKQWVLNNWLDLGFRLGGMTGYTKEQNKIQLFGITPVISPTATIRYNGFGFETSLQTDVLIFTLNYQF
ncbi:hypothetical protein L1D61_25510 [Vibrio mediterranei]|nr:hypothetical protein [Vibrio mediterranei]MCG9790510.1 hypothetical protein [Vibrio mediterranei]